MGIAIEGWEVTAIAGKTSSKKINSGMDSVVATIIKINFIQLYLELIVDLLKVVIAMKSQATSFEMGFREDLKDLEPQFRIQRRFLSLQ